MLVLSRKKSEGIVIQHPIGNVTVTVVRIDCDAVRLGIEAPKDVKILRDELQPPEEKP